VSNQGGRPMARPDTPANRAHLLTKPAGPAEPDDDEEPGSPNGRARGGEQAHRRPWPIVTTVLVVLLVVIVGGGFAGWSYTQHQYYVGASSGQVVIFRGVNQKVAGISLSSVLRRTGIPIGQVTTDDRQQVMNTITASSLADAGNIVHSIWVGYRNCQKAAAAEQQYLAAKRSYQQAMNAYNAQKHKHGKKPVSPASPAAPPPNCPQATSSSASPGGSGTASPSSGTGASP
jgi:hypothetical protein